MRRGCGPLTRPACPVTIHLSSVHPSSRLFSPRRRTCPTSLRCSFRRNKWNCGRILIGTRSCTTKKVSSVFAAWSMIPVSFWRPRGNLIPRRSLKPRCKAFSRVEEDETKHPVCRFIARYHWLSEKLKIDSSRLPVQECRRFTEILDQIKPDSITLIFPASHINSPASMFGHTMLTIDTASKSRLLAYAINYSAVTLETFGPVFAIQGPVRFLSGIFLDPPLLCQTAGVQRRRPPRYLGVPSQPERRGDQQAPDACVRDG